MKGQIELLWREREQMREENLKLKKKLQESGEKSKRKYAQRRTWL